MRKKVTQALKITQKTQEAGVMAELPQAPVDVTMAITPNHAAVAPAVETDDPVNLMDLVPMPMPDEVAVRYGDDLPECFHAERAALGAEAGMVAADLEDLIAQSERNSAEMTSVTTEYQRVNAKMVLLFTEMEPTSAGIEVCCADGDQGIAVDMLIDLDIKHADDRRERIAAGRERLLRDEKRVFERLGALRARTEAFWLSVLEYGALNPGADAPHE